MNEFVKVCEIYLFSLHAKIGPKMPPLRPLKCQCLIIPIITYLVYDHDFLWYIDVVNSRIGISLEVSKHP